MNGGILSGQAWKDGLRFARNLRHNSGVIFIESILEVVKELITGTFPSSTIYTDLKWLSITLALSLLQVARLLESKTKGGIDDLLDRLLLMNL